MHMLHPCGCVHSKPPLAELAGRESIFSGVGWLLLPTWPIVRSRPSCVRGPASRRFVSGSRKSRMSLGPDRFQRCRVTLRRTFRLHRLLSCCRALLRRALPGGRMRLFRQRRMGRGGRSFPFQGSMNRARALGRGRTFRRFAVSAGIGPRGAPSGPFACLALPGRRQIDTGAPRLRETDGDGLLGRTRSMLAFADVMHLLAHKLAGLCRGRLPLALVLVGPLHCLLLWHGFPLSCFVC